MKHIKTFVCIALVLCLLESFWIPCTATEQEPVNMLFNNMDSCARCDMEPSGDRSVKDIQDTVNCLEGAGATQFGYKKDRTGGLFWYGRVPAGNDSVGVDISGATHMTMDLYVSNAYGWKLDGDARIGLRSLKSAQNTNSWDISCGQISTVTMMEVFSGLKTGWNRVVMPIDKSVATETVLWGFRMYFSGGSAKAGFYIIMDDIRFVNQAYLDSNECTKVNAVKKVAMQIAALPLPDAITVAHKTMINDARNSYNALNADLKSKVPNLSSLVNAENALANAGEALDLSVDGLNSNESVVLTSGNIGSGFPSGTIVTDNYTEGIGALFTNWEKPQSGSLAGTNSNLSIGLKEVGGVAGLDTSAAEYVSFDLYIHGFVLSQGKKAYIGFGSQNDGITADLGIIEFTQQLGDAVEGWNYFVLPMNLVTTAVKSIRIWVEGVGLTAEDAYSLLDDVRLLSSGRKAINDMRIKAKPVISAIAAAHASGKQSDVIAARSAYRALSDDIKAYVSNSNLLTALETDINLSFRNLDNAVGVNGGTASMSCTADTDEFLEDSGAVKWEYNTDTSGLFWYVYCDNSTSSKGLDISGAEYMTFDIFVSDATAWNISGSSRVNLSDYSGTWNSVCGQVTSNDVLNAFKGLETGWNHVVLPLDFSRASDSSVWAFRMFILDGTAPRGFYTVLDDIRFVSGAYLQSSSYADVMAGKEMSIRISKLNESSTSDEVYAVQSDYLALNNNAKNSVVGVTTLNRWIQNISNQPIDISFRHMDNGDRTAQEAASSTQNCTMRVEGSGSTKFEHAADRKDGLYWYIYTDAEYVDRGIEIIGATHVIFDFYVNDPSLWNIGDGDMRFAVRNTDSSSWDSSCTEVSSANMHLSFGKVKKGWNHMILPLEPLQSSDAWGIRMFMAKGWAKQGFYTLIDDIRFVNKSYLDSSEYSNIIAAKQVAGFISEIKENNNSETIKTARSEYNNLTSAQRQLVCNYDWLTAAEKGEKLPGTPTHNYNPIPAAHLGDLAGFEKGAFSLAVLSDLHYAVNYDGQEKDVYLNSMQYILDRAGEENTLMALQLGDLTSGNTLDQWKITREGFQKLVDAKLPYATIIGNHDIRGTENAAYNSFMSYDEQVKENPYLEGARVEGRTENLYYTFEVNGVKYMLLTMCCYPDNDLLDWADGVIKAHPEHNVIVMTHSYLQVQDGKLGFTKEVEALANGFKGTTVFEKIIKNNPNVFMTLCAHNSFPSSGENAVGMLTSVNDAGKPVYQFLVPDSQTYEANYGGLGNLFMLRFSADGSTVTGEYIATRYDKDFVGSGNSNYTIHPELVYTDDANNIRTAKTVTDMIDGLSGDDKSAIMQARIAYDALTEVQKALVTNLGKLELLEKARIIFGDVDSDKKITALDALMSLKAAIGKLALSAEQRIKADVNADKQVDAQDALLILQRAVHIIGLFPAEGS